MTDRLHLITAAIRVLKREGAPETPIAILESWLEIERQDFRTPTPDPSALGHQRDQT
jgi:hypothetical protein